MPFPFQIVQTPMLVMMLFEYANATRDVFVERYTLITPDHLRYTATITDPKVFTRPWTMSPVLYRHVEPNAQALDYPCYAFELGDTPLRPSDGR